MTFNGVTREGLFKKVPITWGLIKEPARLWLV